METTVNKKKYRFLAPNVEKRVAKAYIQNIKEVLNSNPEGKRRFKGYFQYTNLSGTLANTPKLYHFKNKTPGQVLKLAAQFTDPVAYFFHSGRVNREITKEKTV